MKFEDLYYGDIFTLPNHAGLSVYMKIPNVLKDDDNKLQKKCCSTLWHLERRCYKIW